jgi:branched-chain amino acid transport system ATP-binding protein
VADVLELAGVTAGYGGTVVLEDVSASLAAGTALAVLGRNGMGKTTLLRTIVGQADLHRGDVRVDGRAVGGMASWRRTRIGIGYVPQEREIFPSLTVLENLTIGARPGEWTLRRIFDLFPTLADRRRHFGNRLSGGEQQMLAVGRALALQPRLLLLDEPFEGLAPTLVEMLARVFGELRRTGLSIVLAEQHARLALGMTDEAILLVRGRVALCERSGRLLDEPQRLDEFLTVQRAKE